MSQEDINILDEVCDEIILFYGEGIVDSILQPVIVEYLEQTNNHTYILSREFTIDYVFYKIRNKYFPASFREACLVFAHKEILKL